mmetsp:Transcript_8554/g.26947  ORF Transcript_8554/g.26947 Transcript_8554/m.26947 type:complete len:95 (-) Transcript_8554:57-341(-)
MSVIGEMLTPRARAQGGRARVHEPACGGKGALGARASALRADGSNAPVSKPLRPRMPALNPRPTPAQAVARASLTANEALVQHLLPQQDLVFVA